MSRRHQAESSLETTRVEAVADARTVSLTDDARYSIEMANTGTWQPADGTNDLGLDVSVSD